MAFVEGGGEKCDGAFPVAWLAGGMDDMFLGQRLRWSEDSTALCCLPPQKTFDRRHTSYLQNLRFQNRWLSLGIWANALHELVASLHVLNKNAKALQYLNQNHLPQKSYI